MAALGFRTMAEMIGRADRLRARPLDHWKGRTLDLSPLLHRPLPAGGAAAPRAGTQERDAEEPLDRELLRLAEPALERGEAVVATLPVRSTDRTVGARLAGEIALRRGAAGLPEGSVRLRFRGAAGQSFGAFAVRG